MQKIKIKAFTLIELLVVIVIIGILSALIIIGMSSTTQKATIAKAQVFSNSLRNSLMDDLVSDWKLDGNTNDSWGSVNGTNNGATLTSDCISGQCYSFNGAAGAPQYVDLTTSTSLDTSSKTIGVWFNSVNGGEAHKTIVGRAHYNGPNDSEGYDLWLNSANVIYATVGDGTANFINASQGSVVVPGKWFYAIMTHNASATTNNLKLYINGIMYDQKSVTGYTPFLHATALGRQSSYDYYYFLGKIDEVRYYDAAIPISQIQQNYYVGLNKLYAKQNIDNAEYQQRIASLRQSVGVGEPN
ncbi:MAG: LamG-like jellyroll fold domain-containing protein [Candidatus Paceibacterota bacterium]